MSEEPPPIPDVEFLNALADKCEQETQVWLGFKNIERAARLRSIAAAFPKLLEAEKDAERWRKLVRLVVSNHGRAGLGAGIVLCASPPNAHDEAWASVQGLDHENPRGTTWMQEASSLAAALDKVSCCTPDVPEGAPNGR